MSSPTTPPGRPAHDEIDLQQVFRALWLRRWLIAILTVAGACAGLAMSLQSTRHVAQSVLLAPDLNVAVYRRYEIALHNRSNLERFLARQDRDAAQAVERLMVTPEPDAWIRPLFSLTEQEARSMGIRAETSPTLLGFRLHFEDRTPGAWTVLPLLADYVRDTTLRLDIKMAAELACSASQERIGTARSEEIQSRFDETQLTARADHLRALLEQARRMQPAVSSALVPSPEEAILTRLVDTEIETAELQLTRRARERALLQDELRAGYYCPLRGLDDAPLSARQLVTHLHDAVDTIAPGSADEDVVRLVRAEISAANHRWQGRLDTPPFLASPEGAELRQRRPVIPVGIVGGASAGLLLGLLATLALGWWRREAPPSR